MDRRDEVGRRVGAGEGVRQAYANVLRMRAIARALKKPRASVLDPEYDPDGDQDDEPLMDGQQRGVAGKPQPKLPAPRNRKDRRAARRRAGEFSKGRPR